MRCHSSAQHHTCHAHARTHTHEHAPASPNSTYRHFGELSSSSSWLAQITFSLKQTASLSRARFAARLASRSVFQPSAHSQAVVSRGRGSLRRVEAVKHPPQFVAPVLRAAARFDPGVWLWSMSSLGESCNKKSRLWRHTMWKGGRFKKEKNASKNNKSQL